MAFSTQQKVKQTSEVLPKDSRFYQDSSHNVHLAAAVAEPPQEIQVVSEESAIQLNKNLVQHKCGHDAQ